MNHTAPAVSVSSHVASLSSADRAAKTRNSNASLTASAAPMPAPSRPPPPRPGAEAANFGSPPFSQGDSMNTGAGQCPIPCPILIGILRDHLDQLRTLRTGTPGRPACTHPRRCVDSPSGQGAVDAAGQDRDVLDASFTVLMAVSLGFGAVRDPDHAGAGTDGVHDPRRRRPDDAADLRRPRAGDRTGALGHREAERGTRRNRRCAVQVDCRPPGTARTRDRLSLAALAGEA